MNYTNLEYFAKHTLTFDNFLINNPNNIDFVFIKKIIFTNVKHGGY
jgi:hypothetical protein